MEREKASKKELKGIVFFVYSKDKWKFVRVIEYDGVSFLFVMFKARV